MKVLVTAASKHGSASEIASAIAARLRRSGLAVDSFAPESVQSLAEYDAVVIGSAVYMRQWMEAARDFVARFHGQLRQMPTWAFSVGMSGVPKRAPQDPKKIGPVSMDGVFDHTRVFAGRYDPTRLSLRERSIARLAGAVEGDFRDWDEVEQWADSIAEALKN